MLASRATQGQLFTVNAAGTVPGWCRDGLPAVRLLWRGFTRDATWLVSRHRSATGNLLSATRTGLAGCFVAVARASARAGIA
jgi:hypothetical protein